MLFSPNEGANQERGKPGIPGRGPTKGGDSERALSLQNEKDAVIRNYLRELNWGLPTPTFKLVHFRSG